MHFLFKKGIITKRKLILGLILMLRKLHNRKAQAVIGEYIVLISMVLAAIVAMTVYFRRAVQARIYDARNYMVSEVARRSAGNFSGDLYPEYEPYYTETNATVHRYSDDKSRLLAGGVTGIFQREYNEIVETYMNSETLPPKDFRATDPAVKVKVGAE